MQNPAPPFIRLFTILSIVTLAGGYVLGHYGIFDDSLPQATAQRFTVKEDGNLYSISEALGERKIAGSGNFKFLFDEKPGKLLVGEGWTSDSPDNVERVGGTTLLLMNEDGSASKKLSEARVLRGKFDTKGENIFFNTDSLDLFKASADGSNVEKIQTKADSFAIAPNGKFLAYQKQNPEWQINEFYDKQLGIAVLDMDTKEEKLISTDVDDFNPVWTPDQKKILFFSTNPEGLVSHFIMNPDGSGRKQLTNVGQTYVTSKTTPIPSEEPVWSADGRLLMYESDREIWINQFDKNYENIVKSWKIGFGKEPKWLSDGKTLSILSGTNTKGGLLKMDINGSIFK